MRITKIVKKILSNYDSDNPGVKAKLCQILMHGRLAGTGKMVILPVDQGFEHGPVRSFVVNPLAYDPHYHFKLATNAGSSAFAAPLGLLEAGANTFAGQVPMILKLNSSNSLLSKTQSPDQAMTASVTDALRLGCAAIGLTIYPGSGQSLEMIEEAREVINESKSCGLPVVIWSYPRGGDLSKEGESAIDVTAYAAHIAALLGAHIIKVKLPTAHLEQAEAKKIYEHTGFSCFTLEERVRHIVQSCFNGKRLVVFSGGITKSERELISEIQAIKNGGGNGSIIGRNSFQRPYIESIKLLKDICELYKTQD